MFPRAWHAVRLEKSWNHTNNLCSWHTLPKLFMYNIVELKKKHFKISNADFNVASWAAMEIKWELQDTLLLRNTDFWRTKQTGCWTSARDTQQGGESQWEKYQFKDKSVKEETHQLVIADARINISRQTVWRKTQSSCLKRKTHTHWCYRINKCYHICIICCCVVCINSAGLQNSLQHSEGYTRRSLSCRWDDISHIWKKRCKYWRFLQ